MSSPLRATIPLEFVSVIAGEIASGVDTAVESWMAQIESVFEDDHLTTLGRLHAIQEILARYKHLTGKKELACRRDLSVALLSREKMA